MPRRETIVPLKTALALGVALALAGCGYPPESRTRAGTAPGTVGGAARDVGAGPASPLPQTGTFGVRVVNLSAGPADIDLTFYLADSVVHRTHLQNIARARAVLVAGPEAATRVTVLASRDGVQSFSAEYTLGVDVADHGVLLIIIRDPDKPQDPSANDSTTEPVDDISTTGLEDVDTSGLDSDTTGLEPVPTNGTEPVEPDHDDHHHADDDDDPPPPPPSDCNTNGIDDAFDIAAGTAADCNGNASPDGCDILAGTSLDTNTTGVPDECECPALDDIGADRLPDMLFCLAGPGQLPPAGREACPCLDFDADGDVDMADFALFQQQFARRLMPEGDLEHGTDGPPEVQLVP